MIVMSAGCGGAPATAPNPSTPENATTPAPAPSLHAEQAPATPVPLAAPNLVELRREGFAAYDAADFKTCADRFHRAAEHGSDDVSRADDLYGAACCASLGGAADEALGYLERAVRLGYADAASLELDPELAAARSRSGWAAVKARAEDNRKNAKTPPPPVPVLTAIDVFGARSVDPEAARRALGFEIGQPFVRSSFVLKQKEDEIKKLGSFSFVKISYINYVGGPEVGHCYLTVDLVEAGDERRSRLLPAPTEQPPDPEGLVARWRTYEDKAWQLLNRGELDMMKATCKVTHCALGFNHPDLAPQEAFFVEKVPAHLDELAAVLRKDQDAKSRAAAAFLLAYAPSPEQAVPRLTPSIRDPSSLVRNNAIRVLSSLQKAAERPLLDLDMALDAVLLPETTDRNKAVNLLKGLLEKMPPKERARKKGSILRQVGPDLVAMTELRQPNNRDPAQGVLTLLSGDKQADPKAWRAWLARQK
jgi:hypothetical protein